MSSKKSFDHIEEKIKQAVENSLPVFDEKAWQALEAKLDKDNKKRRPLLWWFILPLLLTSAGVFYYNLKSSDNQKEKIADVRKAANVKSQDEKNSITKAIERDNTGLKPVENNSNSKQNNVVDKNKMDDSVSGNNVISSGTKTAKILSPLTKTKQITYRKKSKVVASNSGGEAATVDEGKVISGNDNKVILGNNSEVSNNIAEKKNEEKGIVQKNETAEKEIKNETIEILKKDSSKQEQKTFAAKKDKAKTKKTKGLYVQVTAGTDAGSTKLFSYSNSSITPKYGLGVGYQFNNKLSVQTGFYITNKKYTAFAGDYHTKPGSYWGNVDIQKVKAACLIYEIPISVKYNFINKPSFILYGTAGASSYIMQTEDYDYFYIYYNTLHEKKWQYTGNRHLFSTATFSFGIEKQLSSQFCLLAEPSFSIPLSGVGDGKVNLYSSALQLGLKYYFFKK